MNKIILTTIFVSFMSLLYSQYKYELPYYDYNDLRYSTFFEFGKLDTNEFGEDYIPRYLSNGREIEKRFIGDSLWYDSIHRFHEDGSIAFREVSLSYVNYCREYTNDYECMRPNSRIETFYDNGKIRSIELTVYSYPERVLHNRFYDGSSTLIYEELYFYGDTVKGTFWLEDIDSVGVYGVYENSKLIEKWYVYDEWGKAPTIIKVYDLKNNKLYTKPKKIKKKIDETPIVSFYRYFGVANGKGRDFYNYTPVKTDAMSYD